MPSSYSISLTLRLKKGQKFFLDCGQQRKMIEDRAVATPLHKSASKRNNNSMERNKTTQLAKMRKKLIRKIPAKIMLVRKTIAAPESPIRISNT
jgi:hypothetical protein